MDTATLAPATTQFTLEEVVQHGQQSGRSPEEIAGAVKKWRDAARSWGEQNLRESDPKKWFTGNQKLDTRIREELVATQTLAATERIHQSLPDPTMREHFAHQFETAGGDPAKIPEPAFRSLAEKLNREVFQSPAFDLPDAKDRAMLLATEAGVILGDFETQSRPEGGLDILIRLDDEKEGSRRKAITIPEVTDTEVEEAAKQAKTEADRLKAYAEEESSFAEATSSLPQDGMTGVGQAVADKARRSFEEAESRASALADPDRGRLVLLRERVEEQIKSDKDLKKAVGDVALGEDFWRGVQQTHLGARMAIADAAGDEQEKTKLRGLIGELGQIYPGSTNLQFRGGTGAFVSDASSVMGGMLPTMIVSTVTGGAGMATGAAVGGVTRAAALAPISLSAYGTAYATMLNEADALEQQGRKDEADQRRKDARTYAMLQAAVETGSELIFKEEMFQVGGKGLLQKVGAGAAQNTAEEAIASASNAELDLNLRDQLTPASQIARDAALGAVIGGLMQVPGGIVEVFLPKPPPMESAPPGLDDPPPVSDPDTPPPASPPPSSPPPTGESAPPPPNPETPPPGETAIYKVGGRAFTWGEGGWTEQGTGERVDPETEPGLVLQLGEARRQLNAGEQPVSQEVTLNPDETPTILTIDGQRAFLPAPDGKGWVEVFPQTGEAPRPANFASEGKVGIAILRRLQAKMAEKQAAALPPASEPAAEAPAEETPSEEPAPVTTERPADGTVSSGKPNGAKARFRWKIVSRKDLEAMVVRDIEEAQTRQRKGNVASDEQRERMATGLDPDLVMESPVSSMGAPAVFEGKVLAGNGRADGISEAYRRGLAADYEARIREFAAERGLEVPDEPILIREIIDFTRGDARGFVVESNPKRGGMLAESVSEQALLDAETIGDEVLANLTFTADGNLSAGSLAAVAAKLEEANRGITRTLSGQFDRSEAGRRVMAAFLSRLVSRAGRDASDVASILETDGGKRAVSAIAQAAPRLSKLDDDLSLATPIVESLLEFKSGLSAVSKGEFANMADWLENRTSELLASNLDPVSREVLSEMAGSVTSGAAMRDFLDEYLVLAEAEQRERDNSNATGDIFGDERVNQSPEDLFRKLGRIATAPAENSTRTGQGSPNPRGSEAETGRGSEDGRGAETPPVSEAPPVAAETPAPGRSGPLKITDHLRFFPVGLRPMIRRMRELKDLRKPTWDQRFEMDLARHILGVFNSGRKTIPREIWPWFEEWEYLDRIPEFAAMFSKEELIQIRDDILETLKNAHTKNPPAWMEGTDFPTSDDVRIKIIGTIGDALKLKEQPQAPTIDQNGEGQLIPEGEMPFNLSGEVIVEPEVVEPEDTRTDAEKDAESGQSRLFEDRIADSRSAGADTDPEFDELLRAMRARFPGHRRGRSMRDHRQQHFTTYAFERAFAQHVAAGDFQAAYEAVRDSEDSVRIPALKKWMKEARKGDPVAQKNLEWISAIFNGTLPPGVTQQPTTGGSTSTGPAPSPRPQQQAPPPPPPPTTPKSPPPRPEGVEKLNIPALVFLARKMGTIPLVRRFGARGSFTPSNKRGERQDNPVIKVHEYLAKEDWQGAARTLAHEIGHFIDYIVNAVPHADIVKRLVPLKAIRDQFIEDIFGAGTAYTAARKYLMEEAIALSKLMRGDFSPTDSYRNSAVELYADFMSAVMIDPDLAFDTAPLLSHAWFAHLNQKPEAEAAWNLVQDLIKGDALHDAIRKDRIAEQRGAMTAVRDRADRRNSLHAIWRRLPNTLRGALWSRYLPAAAKGATASGKWRFTARWWEAVTHPKEKDFLARMEGAEIEASQRGSVLRVKMQRDVYDPLSRHGIDTVQLDEYLTFFQILNEDTATRRYLEANPEEFREFLLWLDDAAGLDRAAEIEGAADSELDAIGASLVGTIQLHEKFETVYAMAQSADAPDIAARGLFAFDIARYQWNQEGHTPETAQKGMDFLRRELGDERFGVLRDAAHAFHRNLAGIVREANEVGLFGERVWSEKIAPNLGNYVPRMVLDYFTGEMSASIKQRRGSVKTTLPKHLAGEGQAMVLLHKIAKQKQMLFILEQAAEAGWANEIQPITIPRGKDVGALAKKLSREENKGIRGYFVKGKWKWLVFDDADVVRWMDTAVPDDLNALYRFAKANEGFWRLSVTVLNASFALYNNWVRTAVTLPFDYGPRAVAHALRQIPEAVNWAKASLGLAAPSDRVLALVERGVLPAFGQYTAGDLLLSHDDLIDQISAGLVGIDALRRGTRVFGPFEKVANLPGIHQVIQFLGLFTGTAEALPKLAVESLLAKRGLPQWERDRLARMEGIPNTGLSAGKYGTYAGLLALFYRVWVQGTRRLATLPFNPRTRGAWWTGNLLGLGLIKAFYAAAAAGLIDALAGGDDEEKQVDWQEAYTRISPYKIRMADAFFLGWALPDGSYEPPWGHSSIPANWTPMMWRVPFTESGRATAPLASLWTWAAVPDNPLGPRNSAETMRVVRDIAQNSILPSLNPVFENGLYAASIFNPRSPYDAYSGRDVVPRDEWNAGIPSRVWGITKHLLEETPARNLAPAVKTGIRNEDDLPTWARALMSIPGASAAISFDNSPLAADYIDRVEERDSVNREARLLRGPKAIKAVSLRSRLIQIPADERTPKEQAKIEILNEWYRKAYLGSDLYPGLFRELQAAAAGVEGIDAKAAKRALEETAGEVLRAVGGVGR